MIMQPESAHVLLICIIFRANILKQWPMNHRAYHRRTKICNLVERCEWQGTVCLDDCLDGMDFKPADKCLYFLCFSQEICDGCV